MLLYSSTRPWRRDPHPANPRIPADNPYPDPAAYEATPEDVAFLRDLDSLDSPEGIAQFERLITHFELTEHRDFDKYFKNTKAASLSARPVSLKPKLPNNDLYLPGAGLFPPEVQNRVISYWHARQKRLRRPLLRRHWRILHLSNHGFGEQDNNKLAFANRANNKMNLRKSNRMLSGMPLVEKLKELLKENEQALFIVKMVRQREVLKMDQLTLGFNQKDVAKYSKRVGEHLDVCRGLVERVKDKVLSDQPFAESNREEKEDNEQDFLVFFTNIINELNELDLRLDDFKSLSLDAMKDKFFKLKKMAGIHNPALRSYSQGGHSKGGAGTFDTLWAGSFLFAYLSLCILLEIDLFKMSPAVIEEAPFFQFWL